MPSGQSPIFIKIYDLLLWLLNHTERFPKNERFRMAKRLEDTAFEFQHLLVQAARKQNKRQILQQADLELEKLRLYVRLSRDCGTTKPRQYEHAARLLTEIGKLLGGWLKTVS